jgi:antitoxin component YwqK of YwqJK toxin-antitoxin module
MEEQENFTGNRKEYYENGKLNGIRKCYHKDGTLESDTIFINDKI